MTGQVTGHIERISTGRIAIGRITSGRTAIVAMAMLALAGCGPEGAERPAARNVPGNAGGNAGGDTPSPMISATITAEIGSNETTTAEISATIAAPLAAATPAGSPVPHETMTMAGHYLAARQALYFNDVTQSAGFFLRTLESEPGDVALLQQAFLAQYYYGDIERAAALGRQLESLNVVVPLGGEPATALVLRNGDWTAARILADRVAEDSRALVMAGLIRAWSLVAVGQGDAGISELLETGRLAIDQDRGMPAYFRLHAALMAERLGLAEEARQRVTGLHDTDLPAHVALQLAAFHARHGDWDLVHELVETRLSDQFNRAEVIAALKRQATSLPTIQEHIADGIVAMALEDQGGNGGPSLAARLRFSLFITPGHHFARLLLAQNLADLGLYQAALDHLNRVPDGGIYGQLARLAEAAVIEDQGDIDDAIARMQTVVSRDPANAYLFHRIGDSYRRNRQFTDSRDAYMTALALGRDTGGLHRSLGVALERLGEAAPAEMHLLRAIEINPGDAYALNYLGYWWADEERNLDEAIAMIERAVSQLPTSGFFVDSLGWVHFKLGDAARAVDYLERATELEPADPEITGHLGDVYWALGRQDEARYKWRLALSLASDAEEQEMFRDRIRSGLNPEDMPPKNIPPKNSQGTN